MAGKTVSGNNSDFRKRVFSRCLFVAAIGFTVLLAGCAATAFKPVTEENKNQTKAFDGDWQVNIRKAAGRQHGPGNWIYNCGGEAGQFNLAVNDSVAKMPFEQKVYDTYIDDAGKFRFEIPLETKARAGGTSDSSVNQNKMTLIVTGSLKEQSGLLVWGVAEFGNDGCKSKLTMARR